MAQTKSERFARHGLADIRRKLRARFAGDLVIRDSITNVLDSIIDGWDTREPVETRVADQIADAVERPLDALLNGDQTDAKASAEALSRAWQELRERIGW